MDKDRHVAIFETQGFKDRNVCEQSFFHFCSRYYFNIAAILGKSYNLRGKFRNHRVGRARVNYHFEGKILLWTDNFCDTRNNTFFRVKSKICHV